VVVKLSKQIKTSIIAAVSNKQKSKQQKQVVKRLRKNKYHIQREENIPIPFLLCKEIPKKNKGTLGNFYFILLQ
jgi:hypothetical protein